MSGDSVMGPLLSVNADNNIQLNILRHLVKECRSVDLPTDDGSTTSRPVQQSVVEDDVRIDILLSVIATVTDCVALRLTAGDEDDDVIKDLFQCKRPAHAFFSQVYKKSDSGLSPDVLATFCDVSVVKFFSRCNTHSNCHAIDWCLQYLLKMFHTLDPLLQSTGSGWYNARVKARKASSIAGMQYNIAQMGGAAGSGDQNAQPQRRRSGCIDHSKLDMTQLQQQVSTPDTVTLDSYTPPVASTMTHFGSTRKRNTFRAPPMIPIAEETPDIISSNTIDMSIVRFSPDVTEPCSPGNDPLVCMPQPDSLPSSPTDSYTESDVTCKKKSVRFENSDGELDLVEYELQYAVSCEGRIGLIAILNAIGKLPVKMTNQPIDERNAGKVHDDNSLWNEGICDKVFKLIQKCINSSLFTEQDNEGAGGTSDEASNAASYKRRAYRLNRTKPKRNVYQKSLLASYFDHVMEYTFQALVQCALFIRCSAKNVCYKQLVKYSALYSELHDKLSTICTHSGAAFKKYLQEFVKKESVEKVLAFLHATLGFCAPAADDDNLGNWYEHKVKIVVSVLKNLMDKIVCLDLMESHVMKMSITYEACRLVAYSLDLLSDDTFEDVQDEYHSLQLKKYVMYTQRLVLSSISPVIRNIHDNTRMSGSVSGDEFVYTSTGLRLWNNLPIDELKLHVERFVVLMHLSEPGTIPSAGLLASIIDMTSLPVLVRGAVLFECALYVNRIRNGWLPPSLEVNCDVYCKKVLMNFKQWGEAVGSKLEELEELEQEKVKEEEPVLPKETSKGYLRISFSLKMMACQLLAEITYLLRDPPSRYNPYIATHSPSSTTQNTPRPSNITAPMDSHSEHEEPVAMAKSSDYPRSSASSLEPGVIHSRSNSLDVPRHLTIPSDQGSDTSGGEEIHHKKLVILDTPVVPEMLPTPNTPTPRPYPNLIIPPTTPEALPSIVIASPTVAQRRRSMLRRGSLPQGNFKLKPLTGSFDKQQTTQANSPTSYIHRKLSTFKDSFRKVRMKSGGRKSAIAKASSPFLNRRKSLSTPMSRAGSHKSLCDDPLCNNLPWLNVVTRLYHRDMLHKEDNTLLSSCKMCCVELEGALRRLYTLPSRPADDADNTSEIDGRRFTVSPDDTAFHHGSSMSRRDKGSSFTSSWTGSFSSSGTFRFSRASISFAFPFRRHSQFTPHRESLIQENRAPAISPNKSLCYDEEELFGDNIEGALEKHAMMLQSRRIKDNDDRKIKYLNKEVKGLLHTPFTILQLAMAADLIDTANVVNVRDMCWYLLLDTNQELVQSAAMTFLWTVEKCKTLEFHSFFNQNVVIDSSVNEKLKSITRFMVLWRNRHNCSLNEKDALRRLKMKNSPIGYALPSPLLGLPLLDIPVAPWESYTVCSADNCEENAARCHKPTRLVPKLHHLKDLKKLSQSFFVSGISVAKKSAQEWLRSPVDPESTSATMTTDAANVPTSNQTALFPSSLLCFLQFLIDSVTISSSVSEPLPLLCSTVNESTKVPYTSVSDAARMVLWTCMVEDHDLFFQPFLGCFKKENKSRPANSELPVDLTNHQQLENVLHSLRCLNHIFPKLPSEAAQYLFNHLIGVIMQHRLQPYSCSNVIISEVMVLLRGITPSVQGLDCKVFKNVLKKEKCYNTVMTTANLQAVQGKYFIVKVKCSIDHHMHKSFRVYANTTFRDLTSNAVKAFQSSLSDSSKLDSCILIDDATKQPMLDDLFIHDHYYSSVRDTNSEDDRYIVFQLQQSKHPDKLSFERRSLFWYKMGEISRVVILIHMLYTGPSSSTDEKVSVTSLPHYKFMLNELSELDSFPRKALDNILHLNGPISPSIELRITDIMHKGVWLHFIFMLFQIIPDDYAWSHEIIFFISVVTGSLLLYADDAIVLQGCLSTLLLAATKFNDIFKQRGYNTVAPILAQVYTLHHHNKVVLQAIEHIWGKFYFLNDNVFVMQAVTSLAALLCSKTNNLEGNTQLSIVKPPDSFVSDFTPSDVAQRAQSVKAIFQLIKSLRGHQLDVLDVEDRIPIKITRQNSQHSPQSPSSFTQQEFLYTVFDLCIAVAGAHPDSLRGMQMMVFLDHHMQLFLYEFDQLNDDRWSKHIIGIKALVKGAESLIKVFRAQQRRGVTTGAAAGIVHQDSNAMPLTSTFASLLHRLTRLNTVIKSAMARDEEENGNQEGYKKDLVEAHWKRTRISSLCLLSLCSKFVHHLQPALKRNFSRYSNTIQMLAELFTCEVKLLTVPTLEKLTLENRGLNLFVTHFLPSLSWAEERSIYQTFSFVLKSISKLFRKYQAELPSKETWDTLVKWMGGITSCLSAPTLAASQSKTVKSFIDNITGNGLPADNNISEHYLESWPWEFSRSVVLMIYQMIKHGITSFCNYMTDIIKGKKLFIKTILIPFCVEYGQHECLKSTSLMRSILEIIEAHLREQVQQKQKQVQCGMQALRAFAVSFVDLLELVDWNRICLLLTIVIQKKCATPNLNLHAPIPARTYKPLLETLKSVIEFCTPFLSSYRTSLRLLLKALLTQVESKLQILEPLHNQGSMVSDLSRVIDSCKSHSLIRQFSKTALLSELESDLVNEVNVNCDPLPVVAESTTVTSKAKFVKKKKNRLKTTSSFKGESSLGLIKEDITDPESFSPPPPPVENVTTSDTEQQWRSSKRTTLQRDSALSDSDDDYNGPKEQILPTESRKRTRTIKSRLMALHMQPTEDYDGDYEDEIPTPVSVSFDTPDKVFEYAAATEHRSVTIAEVHHSMKKSRSSDSSVETSNDNASLIPNKTASTSAVRKLSHDRHSASSSSIKFNLMDRRQHSNNSLKQFKVFLKGHSSYESTV